MQLTNFAFMASRQNYLDAQRASFKSSSRIATGSRMIHSSDDAAAISQAGKMKSDMLSKSSYIQNLKSARSYLKFQEAGYQKVFTIYQRMEELSSESLLQPKGPSNPLNKEFEELRKELENIKNSKMNGVSMFDPVATCGEISDIDVRDSALNYTSQDLAVSQTIRGKSQDVGAYGGTLSFKVNSGNAGEIYRVFMGDKEIFSTGPSFNGSDPTTDIINSYTEWSTGNQIRRNKGVVYNDQIYKNISGGNFTINGLSTTPDLDSANWRDTNVKTSNIDTNGALQSRIDNADSWQTSGSAGDGDPDTIKLTFGPGVETTYEFSIGNSNLAESFNIGSTTQSKLHSEGGKIRIADLGINSSETQLSLHVETKSIGVISDVKFEPIFFDKQLDIDTAGNQIALKAVGFETFENFSIDSSSSAKQTSDHLLGMGGMMGEIECIGANWLPKIASAINRIDSEILAAESNSLGSEIALGRIVGSDMALETTNHAKQMLKMDMAAFVMSNTTRINDVLAPLTTEHHRSKVMNGSALL